MKIRNKDISNPKAKDYKKVPLLVQNSTEFYVTKIMSRIVYRRKIKRRPYCENYFYVNDISIKKQDEYKKLYEQEIDDVNRAVSTLEKYRID